MEVSVFLQIVVVKTKVLLSLELPQCKYSALHEERETDDCFLVDQLTRQPNKYIKR